MLVSDFDFTIREVLLIHRNCWVPHFTWTHYRGGRQMDGLVYALSGAAQYDFGANRITLRAGMVFFLPASTAYTVRCISDEPFLHYTVNFRLADIQADSESIVPCILCGERQHIVSTASSGRYGGHFERLLALWQEKPTGYRILAKAYIYELLSLYLSDAEQNHHPREQLDRLRPAVERLDRSFSEEISIGELASLCGLSETHFRRLFRQIYGIPPAEYRTEKRISHAKELLTLGQHTTAEIARECGFSDPSYFTRVFHSKTNRTPGEYRSSE